jgi:hypothetical protein
MSVVPAASAPTLDAASREWLRALRADGATRDEAIARLHALLLRAARFGRRAAAAASYDIDTLWIAPDPDNGGLLTFFATGTETDTFRGQSQSFSLSGSTGIPAFSVHRPILQFFGVPTPPGDSINVQVAYKPAH